MENFDNPATSSSNVNNTPMINDQIRNHLLETSKWMKFLSIIGFIGLGLMVIAALVILVAGSSFESLSGAAGGTFFIALIYLLMAVLYFFPVLYLFKSATGLKNGLIGNNNDQLVSGFENLKSHYKFVGIFMIVILSIYALVFVLGIFAFAMR